MNPKPSKDAALDSGAYALHALSDAENAQFEALMRDSEELRAEAIELSDTAVELGLSVEPIEPSASLRASILDAIATTPQLAPLPAVEAEPEPVMAPVIGLAEERARRHWYTRPAVTLVAAAAAVALVFGGGVGINAIVQNQQSAQTASAINQIQAASDYQRRTVDVSNGGSATLIWSASLKRSALLGSGMTKLSNAQTYELWYIGTKGARAAGTFEVDGASTHSVMLTGAMAAGDTIGLTIEPAGGSTVPTSKPIALVTTA